MKPIALLVALLAFAPQAGCSATSSRSAGTDARPPAAASTAPPPRRAATPEELERYAAREQQSAGLEKFEGGRIDTGTIIVVLLLVIIIIILV